MKDIERESIVFAKSEMIEIVLDFVTSDHYASLKKEKKNPRKGVWEICFTHFEVRVYLSRNAILAARHDRNFLK